MVVDTGPFLCYDYHMVINQKGSQMWKAITDMSDQELREALKSCETRFPTGHLKAQRNNERILKLKAEIRDRKVR